MKRLVTTSSIFTLFIFPILSALAQVQPDVNASTTLVVEATMVDSLGGSSTPSATIDASSTPSVVIVDQTSASPQDTSTDQQATSGSVLESTTDPSQTAPIDTTTPLDPVVVDPTAPPVVLPIDPTVVDMTTPSTPITPIQTTQPVTQVTVYNTPATSIAEVTENELVPEKKYTFALAGAAIPTKASPDWQKGTKKVTSQVANAASVSADDSTGTLSVSGNCSDPYFVVLLYKNQEDYNDNPSSYIFNKAFDCKNGTYNYSIKELPKKLDDGVYYLLIGGQGNEGSWKPITALMPVTIQKND